MHCSNALVEVMVSVSGTFRANERIEGLSAFGFFTSSIDYWRDGFDPMIHGSTDRESYSKKMAKK